MIIKRKIVLYWAPRIAGILLCISTFAYIFELPIDNSDFYTMGIGLLPTIFTTLLLVMAWRNELSGGVFFILLGLAYIATTWNTYPIAVQFRLAIPMVATGVLFIVQHFNNNKSTT